MLHFATHAVVKDHEPFASFLALGSRGEAEDGQLTAQEIYRSRSRRGSRRPERLPIRRRPRHRRRHRHLRARVRLRGRRVGHCESVGRRRRTNEPAVAGVLPRMVEWPLESACAPRRATPRAEAAARRSAADRHTRRPRVSAESSRVLGGLRAHRRTGLVADQDLARAHTHRNLTKGSSLPKDIG